MKATARTRKFWRQLWSIVTRTHPAYQRRQTGDDDLVEILRRYPPEVRRAMLAQLEEMRCRLDDDLAERTDKPRDPIIRGPR